MDPWGPEAVSVGAEVWGVWPVGSLPAAGAVAAAFVSCLQKPLSDQKRSFAREAVRLSAGGWGRQRMCVSKVECHWRTELL